VEEVAAGDALHQSLAHARSNLTVGIAEAEAELARTRASCRDLEDLIATAKVLRLLAGLNRNGDSAPAGGSVVVVVDDDTVTASAPAVSTATNPLSDLMEFLGYS
jgi:hypothetical protein